MASDVTSRHLRNSSELLVRAPIRQGFAPLGRDKVSYASRLRMVLDTLYGIRKLLVEEQTRYTAGPIERLRTLFNSQWAVTPDDRYLVVTVSFDRSWEEYFERLAFDAGPALDLIFHHCDGYARHACVDDGGRRRYQGFSHFIRERQLPVNFYYVGVPEVTVDDIAYYRKLASERNPSVQTLAPTFVGLPGDEAEARLAQRYHGHAARVRDESTVKALRVFYQLRKWFAPDAPICSPDATTPELSVYERAVANLIAELPDLKEIPTPELLLPGMGDWVGRVQDLVDKPEEPPPPAVLVCADLEAIQGNILSEYRDMTHGCSVLLRCDTETAASGFLRAMAARVTSEADYRARARQPPTPLMNLAITFEGLRRLPLGKDILDLFPKEFREGMEERAAAIGDIGEPNHPEFWARPEHNWDSATGTLRAPTAKREPIPLSSVDFVVTLQTRSEVGHAWEAHPLRNAVRELERMGARVLHVQCLQRPFRPESKPVTEHFGFVDGKSQPQPDYTLDGQPSVGEGIAADDRVALGEFLLGHPDRRSEVMWSAEPYRATGPLSEQAVHRLFHNGSFMVIRKLAQDVSALDAYAERAAKALELPRGGDAVKEWMMGRRLSEDAEPLLKQTSARAKDENDFTFAADPTGEVCPLHAHIRRANPRIDLGRGRKAPRILRRSFAYGPPVTRAGASEQPDAERGLLFMAFNASLAQQYEVIQRWLNGGNITGIASAQNDLLTGSPAPGEQPHWVHVDGRWSALAEPDKPFVTLQWGLYAFAPSRDGLRWLADHVGLMGSGLPAGTIDKGEALIASLRALEREQGNALEAGRRRRPSPARAAWQSVIEEPGKAREAIAVWAAILARHGGVLSTPYGVLVASEAGAREVLGDDGQRFSVREYWHRLGHAVGEHYLSFDPHPGQVPGGSDGDAAYEARMAELSPAYAKASAAPNAYLLEQAGPGGELTTSAFDEAKRIATELLDDHGGSIGLDELAEGCVRAFAERWFGLARAGTGRPDADDFAAIELTSRFAFQPYPVEAMFDKVARDTAEPIALSPHTAFYRHLAAHGLPPDEIRKAIVGAAVGFCAPAVASILLVGLQWLRSGDLFSLGDSYRNGNASEADKRVMIQQAVLKALVRTPVPTMLYRTAVRDTRVAGHPVMKGEYVVVGLGAAAMASGGRWDWLFGGMRKASGRDGDNPHACPARHAALAMFSGTLAAVLALRSVEPEPVLRLRYR